MESTLIIPSEPITTIRMNSESNIRSVSIPELKDAIIELSGNVDLLLDACGVIGNVQHLTVTPDLSPKVLNITGFDLNVLLTSGGKSFVDVTVDPNTEMTPRRRNSTIINKGQETVVLSIRNEIDGIKMVRNKILKPYRKYDVSLICDGAHTLIY